MLAARYVGSKKGEISTSCEKLFAGEAITEAETKEAALAWVPDAMRFDAVSSLGDADIDETLDDEDASDAEGGLTSDDPLEELADHGHDDHEDALEPVNDDATLIAAE